MSKTLATAPKLMFLDDDGMPLINGKLYTYASGTTTPLATYQDAAGASPNTNPIILDSRGEASVFLSAVAYKFVLKDSLDNTIWTVNSITPEGTVTQYESIVVACSDETTALSAGTAKVTFRMPYAMTVTEVRASLSTVQAAGNTLTVDINEAGSSILSTEITIDNGDETSLDATTPPVISDATLANDAKITIDLDQIGDGSAKGLKVIINGYRT